MRAKLSFSSESDSSVLHTSLSYEMSSSSSSSSSSFILPDSPPPHEHILNYWQQKAALAAKASAAAPAPSPLTVEPPSPGEIMLGDSPVQHLAPPATWAPWHAVLTTLSNRIKQKQGKRRLVFDKPEVSGNKDETIFSQTKKCAGMENKSSLVPLMKEVERAEGDGRREMDFVQLINRPASKPWVPLRELKEDAPYPIISAKEHTNKHGRQVILKISNAGSKSVCEGIYPEPTCPIRRKAEEETRRLVNDIEGGGGKQERAAGDKWMPTTHLFKQRLYCQLQNSQAGK
ncbi:uncharacterized protein LOC120351624 [Nilaparvata lugens]|uniref:uncharacterized protein LOC120351624 n=1 Tax=Nilaparvata lugens TaxID=108931 RepID=UPI00193E951A|nr:uncharacterized protein LOC120351624 [Nilaparvata lugens]